MKAGPKVRASRQQSRDARRRATKSINETLRQRAGQSSLSGRSLDGAPRIRRRPAYEIRSLAVAQQDPALIRAWRAYSGKTSLRMGRAGLGNGG